MKKLLAVLVLVMIVGAVNAQRTMVKVSDLPKAITDNVTKSYMGYTIKEATKVIANNATTYEVAISKGMDTQTLLYDKDGKFVKKLSKQEGTMTKPKKSGMKKSPTKTQMNKSTFE